MSKPYLDTSVILCGFHPTEPYKHKAKNLVNADHLISPIVFAEIKNIQRRRFRIYNSISSLIELIKNNYKKELMINDLYKRCFKFNYGRNRHDINHLDSLFEYIIDKLDLRSDMRLQIALLEKFLIEVDDVFNEIQFEFLKIINFLDNPLNYDQRVVKENIGKKYNLLHRLFKKIEGYSSNKNDIKILIHGVEYSCCTHIGLDIISNDKYMVKTESDVKKHSSKVFKRLYFDMFSLECYKMS